MNCHRTVTAVLLALLAVQTGRAHPAQNANSPKSDEAFFPVAAWYGGGKVRAPMLEAIDSTSPERWAKDLDQIRSVGFNTVKTWVDWQLRNLIRDSTTFRTSTCSYVWLRNTACA